MNQSDRDLRALLVRVGSSLRVQRYVGQNETEAAHEFADNALEVLKAIEDRVVARLTQQEEA